MRARAASFLTFQDHTQWHATVGRTPLDGPVRRRDLYLTTHITNHRQISMPPAGFPPTPLHSFSCFFLVHFPCLFLCLNCPALCLFCTTHNTNNQGPGGIFVFVLCLYFILTCFFDWIVLSFAFCPLLYNTHNRKIHAPGGIRASNPSKQLAADPPLTALGHWDRRRTRLQHSVYTSIKVRQKTQCLIRAKVGG